MTCLKGQSYDYSSETCVSCGLNCEQCWISGSGQSYCNFCSADHSVSLDGSNCESNPGADQCGGCKTCVWENYKVCKECKPDYKLNE